MSIPLRTSSAPSAAGGGGFATPAHHHHFHQNPLPSAGSRPTPPAPVVPGNTTTKTPPPAPVTPVEAAPLEDHPPDLIYDIKVMLRYVNSVSDLPAPIHGFGMEQYAAVPDLERPEHMSTGRLGFFGDHVASVPNRLIQHRKLHNEVMGIMSRVGPQNYEAMRDELLQLPIRQSDSEDISQVIDSFFRKSIRPEDAPYTEYYVNLIGDLIEAMGRKDQVGISIRQMILKKCQEVFTGVNEKNEKSDVLDNPEEEELRQKQIRDKGKANIKLLGLLYNRRLVNEKIPQTVLYELLYGPEQDSQQKRHKHVPSAHDIDLFVDLLTKIAKNVTEVTSKYFENFYATLHKLSKEHESRRIQFKLMDFVDLMKRDFNPVGSQSVKQYDTQVEERRQAVVEMKFSEFRDIMDSAIKDPGLEKESDIATLLSKPTRIEYIVEWLHSRVRTVSRVAERQNSGELFKRLLDDGVFSDDEVNAALEKLLPKFADDFITDYPKGYENWAEVVAKGQGIFHLGHHSQLLRLLADNENSPVSVFFQMIRDVCAKTPNPNPDPNPQLPSLKHRRFRVLPALLRIPPVSDEADEDAKALSEPLESNPHVDKFDEVTYYTLLSSGANHASLLQPIIANRQQQPSFMSQIVCAVFCFVRFNIAAEFAPRKLDDALGRVKERTTSSSITAAHVELMMLAEVYWTWMDLDRCPLPSFNQFIQALATSKLVSPASIAQFKAELHITCPEHARLIH